MRRRNGLGAKLARHAIEAALALAATFTPRVGRAHDIEAPKAKNAAVAPWPNGIEEAHDVVVPVTLVISAVGTVDSVTIDASVSPLFDGAARDAARGWTFEPAIRDGKAIASRIRAHVRFVAKGAASADPSGSRGSSAGAATHAEPSAAPTTAQVDAAPNDREKLQRVTVRGASPPRSASEVTRGRDIIAAAPHRTASDLLNVVPGVFVTQHSGEGKAHQIFLRGFDAVHGQDIEIWVGGIPINEVSNIHGQGYSDLHFAMPEVIKEIQSTPGTYDPRQGDFAVAGTIRMRLGYDEPGITAKGTTGSFGTRRLFLAYHPKDAPDETFAAFEEYSTDGFGPNRAARRGSLIAQATHDFGEGLAARLLATTYSGRFDSAGVLRARDVESGAVDKYAFYDPKQGGYSSRSQLLLELHKDDEGSRFSVAPFASVRSLSLRQNFTGYLTDSLRGGQSQPGSDNTQQLHDAIMFGATASYRRTFKLVSSRDVFEAGFYGRSDWIDQSQRRLSDVNDLPTETMVDAKVRGTDVAGYLDASVFPIPRLALRGGIRVDALSYATQDRVVPKSGATAAQERSAQAAHFGKKITADFAIFPSFHALASYGEGFRSPQARSLSDGERAPFTEVTSYEAGVRYGDAARIQGSLALFHTSLSQDLAFDQTTARNEVVPGTERNGLALELTAKPSNWLTMSSSATYTRATFTGSNDKYSEGDLLPYVPQLVVRTDMVAKHKLGRFKERDLEGHIGYGVESLVGRPLPYSESGRNVFLVDASAGLRLKEIEVGIDTYNLLNAFWYDGQFVYASNFTRGKAPDLVPLHHVTVGPPRSVFVSLTLHI